MKRSTLWIMAATAGLVVANNYYNQPLLVEFARDFAVREKDAGVVSIVTQLGYALGLLLFVPLGDKLERRRLISFMLCLSAASLVSTASSPTLVWLIGSSFLLGLTSIVPQLLTPFAAHLAGPQQRGRAVGTVMGGLLCGILLSRTFSGFIGAHFGWRTMYWIACGIMLVLAVLLRRILPQDQPSFRGGYAALMRSLWQLYRSEPLVRETSTVAALQFGAFSAFWTTLAFHLDAMPAHYGTQAAGLFGLVGVVGATAAPWAGKLADRKSPRMAVLLSSLVFILSYLIFAATGQWLGGLIVGVILLDLGMQAGHVSNMTRNMSLKPEAMSRANTLYMFIRFMGGALGSTCGNLAWSIWGWPGVCGTGIVLSLLSIVWQWVGRHTPEPARS